MEIENAQTKKRIHVITTFATLLMAAVLLILGTYAWFTVATAPEIRQIQVKLQTTKNFEIALYSEEHPSGAAITENDKERTDGLEKYAWGEQVSFESTEPFSMKLPCVVEGTTIKTVSYDETTGRTAGLQEATATKDTAADGVYYYSVGENKCAVCFKTLIRTNTTGKITAAINDFQCGERINKDHVGISILFNDTVVGTAKGSDTTISCGDLNASDDATVCSVVVYLLGSDVSAMDVSSDADSNISFNLKFTNDAIDETSNSGVPTTTE